MNMCACVHSFQLLFEEVLSHSCPLETIATKGANMAEHCNTQHEVKQLQSRYSALQEKAKVCHGVCFALLLIFWNDYRLFLFVYFTRTQSIRPRG